MNENILEVKSVTKIYNKTRKAVDNVSFTIKSGKIFGFIGPNGAGKSTTIKMITGLTKMTSGSISICGYDIEKDFENAIKNVGGVIENPEMYPYLSGLENLKFYARLHENVTKQKIDEIVKLVGLDKRIKDKVSKYSLGMKQRLGLAQALLHNPKLIILDEPTNGLDVNGIIEIRNLLKILAHKLGVAVLISSHMLSEVEVLCDEIAMIVNGQIKQIKTEDEIRLTRQSKIMNYISLNYPNFAGKLLEKELNIKVKISPDKSKIFFTSNTQILSKEISLIASKKITITGAGKVDLSLEDEFLKVLKNETSDTSIR